MQRKTPCDILTRLQSSKLSKEAFLELIARSDSFFRDFCEQRLNGEPIDYLKVFTLYQQYWRTPQSTPPTMPLYERKSRVKNPWDP